MKKYIGLMILILSIVIASSISTLFLGWGSRMEQAMGRWFVLFGLIKIKNIRAFAALFRNYDFFAMHYASYGLFYPFIEIVLGLGYLMHGSLSSYALLLLYGITIIVLTSTARGIIQFMRSGKEPLQCACLGSSFSLPLGLISLGEQLVMLGMVLYLLFIFSFFPMKNFLFPLLIVALSTFLLTGCSIKSSSSTQVNTDEIVAVGHDGVQFVPSTITLPVGKKYTIQVTPNSDGRGCMTEVVIPGKGPQAIKQGEMFTIEVDGTKPQTIPLVCSSMGMKQGEIVVQ